jgi:hypothetical protein
MITEAMGVDMPKPGVSSSKTTLTDVVMQRVKGL